MPGRSPTRMRRSLRPASTGSAAAQAASDPANMTVSVRARAPGRAARHGRVDVADVGLREHRTDGARGVHPGRRRVDDAPRAPVSDGGEDSAHLLGCRSVGEAEHDDLGGATHVVERRREAGALGVARRTGQVVRDHVEARPDEVLGEDAAHVAQADEADRRRAHLPSSARTAWRARLAESPAGAPQ